MHLEEFLETAGFMRPEDDIDGPGPLDATAAWLDLPPLTRIAATVCKIAGCRMEDLFGPRKSLRFVIPRHVAIWIAEDRRPDLSLPQIGRFFKKDHTTIIHARRQRDRRLQDPRYARIYDRAVRALEASEVARCEIHTCPLWPFRAGKSPFHARAKNG